MRLRQHHGTDKTGGCALRICAARARRLGMQLVTGSGSRSAPDNPRGGQAANKAKYAKDSLIVRFRNTPTASNLRSSVARVNGTIEDKNNDGVYDRFSHIASGQLAVVKLGAGADVNDAIEELRKDPEILYAERNYIVKAIATPNDPRFPQLYGLDNTGQTGGTPDADIDARRGVGHQHGQQRRGRRRDRHRHRLQPPRPRRQHLDQPGRDRRQRRRRRRQRLHRRRARLQRHQRQTATRWTTTATARTCAGTIGAVGNNGIGVAGVNWDARSWRSSSSTPAAPARPPTPSAPSTTRSRRAQRRGVNLRVLSNSWGGGGFCQALLDAINAAGDAPACCSSPRPATSAPTTTARRSTRPATTRPTSSSVAATDHNDALADFSNYGATTVDLGAPGVDVLSPSRATPTVSRRHVDGDAARGGRRCPGAGRQRHPHCRRAQGHPPDSGDPLPALEGITVSGNRLNAAAALEQTGPPVPRFSLSVTPPSIVVTQEETATYGIDVASLAGFEGDVALTVTSDPAIDATLSITDSVPAPGTGTLTVETSLTTVTGLYTLTITGESGELVRSRTVRLRVRAEGDPLFGLTMSPESQTIFDSDGAQFNIAVESFGLEGNVSLTFTSNPPFDGFVESVPHRGPGARKLRAGRLPRLRRHARRLHVHDHRHVRRRRGRERQLGAHGPGERRAAPVRGLLLVPDPSHLRVPRLQLLAGMQFRADRRVVLGLRRRRGLDRAEPDPHLRRAGRLRRHPDSVRRQRPERLGHVHRLGDPAAAAALDLPHRARSGPLRVPGQPALERPDGRSGRAVPQRPDGRHPGQRRGRFATSSASTRPRTPGSCASSTAGCAPTR